MHYVCCYSNGFEEERVKAILHQIELAMKHQSSNFGLSLISVCTYTRLHQMV